MASWLDISRDAKPGMLVALVRTMPACGAQPSIPAGTTARIVENSLNEMQPILFLQVDGDDGAFGIFGPDPGDTDHWDQTASVVILPEGPHGKNE